MAVSIGLAVHVKGVLIRTALLFWGLYGGPGLHIFGNSKMLRSILWVDQKTWIPCKDFRRQHNIVPI